ncbi:copper chaperone PCu(A)C [Cryobacterium sp. PH31-O1]|uniref:copper chaperone PCu(A)C n=1 Tax=Cryobacterium sp. PH31-O1 TaxID=3046306 RepID=UPI0024B8E241|nr:copper chaperone PCu(A)C [Cryobacterium sp. PH31-O1]MDJ0337857.1 copper chaperone PCu(A)C [Cryobacterium sp. PH31-O1]
MTLTTTPRILIIAVAALLTLSGCASTTDTAAPAATTDTTVETTAATSLAITDPWVKSAETGMSAAFGTLTNSSDTDINIVAAMSPAATMIELHETVEDDSGAMVMQQKEGGFIVPANGSYELAPGANHLMMMGLTEPLVAGAEQTFTLTLSDESTFEFTAPAKDYSGANENYEETDK